jgi:hypothetical protein
MAAKRRYSDLERAGALAALAANAGDVSKTARALGMPRKTLAHWAKEQVKGEALAKDCQEKKRDLADLFEDLARAILGVSLRQVDLLPIDKALVAAGIAVDKMLLLRGEPTAIYEQRNDERLRAFRDRYGVAHAAGPAGANGPAQPLHP